MPISINVNVDKVDKARFFKGKKGRYMDLVFYETPDSDYGDYLVKQRGEKGERMVILGNGKYFKPKDAGEKKGNTDDTDKSKGSDKEPW